MSEMEIRIVVTLDESGQREPVDALRDIVAGVENYIGDYFTADNPTSSESKFRYDGWEGPFVTKVEGRLG
jgi:hypothetical protein